MLKSDGDQSLYRLTQGAFDLGKIWRNRIRCAAGTAAFISMTAFLTLCIPASAGESDFVDIIPPVGWTAIPRDQVVGHGPFVAWVAPFDPVVAFWQNINIARRHSTGSLVKDVTGNLREIRGVHPDIDIWESKSNRRCRGNASWLVTFSYQGESFTLAHEAVFTISRGALFIATYTREISQRPYATARNTVEGMCASKGGKALVRSGARTLTEVNEDVALRLDVTDVSP
jgi:hypothetical protein